MSQDQSFSEFGVPELKDFLRVRGISCSIGRKRDLVRLCQLAVELDLEILESEDDYKVMDTNRRTVSIAGKDVVIQEPSTICSWTKSLQSLPDIEYCDILIYFMKICTWREERLKNYKNDNGYRLFLSHHIDNVCVSGLLEDNFVYVKATCVPETRQSATPYDVWILVSNSGEIKSGGCTCVVDNGTCKHCVALLFALTSFCTRHKDRNTQVGTDIECVWDKPRKASLPMEIDAIDMRIDQSIPPPLTPTASKYQPSVSLDEPHFNIEKEMKTLLCGTDSLLLQTLYNSDDDESNIIATIPNMMDIVKAEDSSSTVFQKLQDSFDSDTISIIEETTRGQSDNPKWFLHRKGRITASLFSSVLHFRDTESDENYISRQVMGESKMLNTPSVLFGKQNEPIARQLYFDKYTKNHQCAKVELCGLYVAQNHPYLGASPDGLVKCKCCGEGLLEIKCSFKHKDLTPLEVCQDNNYHVYLDENKAVRLKSGSPWYAQIQGQLGVCNKNWCDFVLFTNKGCVVDRIYFDENLYCLIVEKSRTFFEHYIIRALKRQ